MATPNYSYEKRQRELAKKRKADEKRQKKTRDSDHGGHQSDGNPNSSSADNAPVNPTSNPTN